MIQQGQQIAALRKDIEALRQQVVSHPLYAEVTNMETLHVFMEYHVYAVWDFMSLLKSLQLELTCTSVPWFPVGHGDTRYLVNEIVLGEESDVDLQGNKKSHFEMYLDAMEQAGANTAGINRFIESLQQNADLESAFTAADTPAAAREFVRFTMQIAGQASAAVKAAVFTFGREDLIPDMFLSIIQDIYQSQPDKISFFKYYLERHIEVDGGHHGELALQMIASLCGDNAEHWADAGKAAGESLQQRIGLWNGCLEEIKRILVVA